MSEKELRTALKLIDEVKVEHNKPEAEIEYRNGRVIVTYEYETEFSQDFNDPF